MNTFELIATIRRTGQISQNDPIYTDTEILAEATQALRDRFAAPLMLCRQGFWLHEAKTTTESGQAFYKIPANTIVQGLEKVEIADSGSNSYRQLLILTQTQASVFTGGAPGEPTHFTLESDHVRLWPAPSGAFSLRFVFYLQPPALVIPEGTCRIAGPCTNTTLTIDSSFHPWLVPGAKFYVQNHDGTHEVPCFDGRILSITGAGPYTINTDGPYSGASQIQLEDHVTVAGESNFPMLPEELHRPLCDYTAGEIWTSKGDKEKATALLQKSSAGINRFVDMAVSRVKTRPITWKRTNSYLRKAVG